MSFDLSKEVTRCKKDYCHLSNSPRLGPPLQWKISENGREGGRREKKYATLFFFFLSVNTVEMG